MEDLHGQRGVAVRFAGAYHRLLRAIPVIGVVAESGAQALGAVMAAHLIVAFYADEVQLAADALIADGVDAVFTPTDNTIMTAELSIYEKFIDAGIPHYTGADSFALNGAFVGYGVDYANLGQKTADMIADILIDNADPSKTAVETFDNGTATVNTETCKALGLDFDTVKKAFEPLCTQVNEITTAESFDEVESK